jgi:hypothetical protein
MTLSNALGRRLLAEQAAKGRKASTKTPKQQAQALANKEKRKSKSKLREQCPTGKIYAQQLGLNTPAAPASLMEPGSFFIPFNVVSKKNSKQAQRTKTGHTRVISSEAYLDYAKLSSDTWTKLAPSFRNTLQGLTPPYRVQFTFIRAIKARFDYCNLIQGPLDLMQEHGWIDDDDADTILPSYAPYAVSAQCAGVVITVLR